MIIRMLFMVFIIQNPHVKKRGNHKLVVDVSEITRGANIILIKTDKGSASFRIIVE